MSRDNRFRENENDNSDDVYAREYKLKRRRINKYKRMIAYIFMVFMFISIVLWGLVIYRIIQINGRMSDLGLAISTFGFVPNVVKGVLLH